MGEPVALFPAALAARTVAYCQFCGRPLTDPESIARHAGPVCLPPPPKPPRPVADQPALPGMGRAPTGLEQDATDGPVVLPSDEAPARRVLDPVAAEHGPCETVLVRFRGLEVRVEAVEGETDEQAIGRAVAAWAARRVR